MGAAQTASNISTAIANNAMGNINEITPDGRKRFNQTGTYKFTDPTSGKVYDLPTYTLKQSLSPAQQKIKAQQDRADLNLSRLGADQSARVGQLLGKSIDVSGLPSAGTVPAAARMNGSLGDVGGLTRTYGTDFSQDRQRHEDALFSRLNPQLERDRESLRTSLANQGIREGSEAFDRAMGRFGEQSNDARMQAILAGGQEQSRMVGLEAQRAAFENAAQGQAFDQMLTGRTFANNAGLQNFQNDMAVFNAQNMNRDRALQETFALRNQPLNEISALMSGSQVSMPQFMTGAQVAPIPTVDQAGLMQQEYANKMNAWQQKQAAWGGLASGLGGLFGGIGAMRG